MKLCFSTLGCTDRSLDEILSVADQFNIRALEIRGMGGVMDNRQIEALLPHNEEQTKQKLSASHIVPHVLGTSCAFHDPNKLEAAIAEGKASIDIAERFGIPYIRVFGNKLVGETDEERSTCYARVANGIATLCRYAKETHVSVLLEVHGDYTSIETLGKVTEQLTEYSNFGLIWDIAHTAAYGDRWYEFYRFFRPLIRHVHIKDRLLERNVLTLPGEGELPIIPIVQTMMEDGFDGYFSLEWEKKWHPELPDLSEALSKFVSIMRRNN